MSKALLQLFPFYGSKSKIVAQYPPPRGDTIIELFAGSASYSVKHGRKRKVKLFETNSRVYAALQYLIHCATEEKILRLPLCKGNETLREMSKRLGFSDGEFYLLSFWIGNGHPHPSHRILKPHPKNQWTKENRLLLSKLVGHISHWEVFNESYEAVLSLEKDPSTTFFIDPPYSNSDGERYFENRENDIDYEKLASMIRSELVGQIIACENERHTGWLSFQMMQKEDGSPIYTNASKRTREVLFHKS